MNGYDYYRPSPPSRHSFGTSSAIITLRTLSTGLRRRRGKQAACRECLRRALLACISADGVVRAFTAEELYSQFG